MSSRVISIALGKQDLNYLTVFQLTANRSTLIVHLVMVAIVAPQIPCKRYGCHAGFYVASSTILPANSPAI